MHVESRACSVFLRTITTGPDFLVTMTDRGRPINGLRLRVAGAQATTDKDGVAAFHHIAQGQYVVSADHDDGVPDAVNLEVKTNGPRSVNVHLKWPAVPPIEVRSVTGALNLAQRAAGASSCAFDVYVLDGLSGRVLQHEATTNSGAFNFSDLPDGLYFLKVRQAASTPNQFAPIEGLIGVSISPNAKQEQLNLVLGMTSCGLMYTNAGECSTSEIQMQSLSGQVVDPEGAVIPRADVLLFNTAAVPALIANVNTDFSGNFALHDLPTGSYRLEIAAPGFTPAKATVHLRPGTTPGSNRSVRIQLGILGSCSVVAIP
jgi:hypothetical protein